LLSLALEENNQGVSEMHGIKVEGKVQGKVEEGVEVHQESTMPTIGSGGAASPESGSLGALSLRVLGQTGEEGWGFK
jgi:hypothetical protein